MERLEHDDERAVRAADEQAEINAEERATSFEEREARVSRREAAADARHAVADERDRAADERERIADERERVADEREHRADQREELADAREQRLNDLEARADARARSVGMPTASVPERVLETIARGRALLAASNASLDRSQAAVERQLERTGRDQLTVDREVVATARDADAVPAAHQRADHVAEEHLVRLRQQFLAAAADLAHVEEQIADGYERAVGTDPERHARHIKLAQQAREAARHARLAAAQVTGDDEPDPAG